MNSLTYLPESKTPESWHTEQTTAPFSREILILLSNWTFFTCEYYRSGFCTYIFIIVNRQNYHQNWYHNHHPHHHNQLELDSDIHGVNFTLKCCLWCPKEGPPCLLSRGRMLAMPALKTHLQTLYLTLSSSQSYILWDFLYFSDIIPGNLPHFFSNIFLVP